MSQKYAPQEGQLRIFERKRRPYVKQISSEFTENEVLVTLTNLNLGGLL